MAQPPLVTSKFDFCTLTPILATGYSWESPLVDRVSTRHRHNVDRCFAELLRRGYQRIGMHLLASSVKYADSNWSASYLLNQSRLPGNRRLPLFTSEPEADAFPAFEKWYRRWRPDALITSHGFEVAWAERLGLTRETLGIVCFNRPPLPDIAGMDENSHVVGRMACDLVISKLAHNEIGLPQHPRLILIEGTWRDGESLPPEG